MIQDWSRAVCFAMGALLSAGAAIALLPIRTGAIAAEQPLDTLSEPDIGSLKLHLEALEQKVERMNEQRSTISAPFTVLGPGADGQPIFTITVDEGGRPRLTVGGAGGASVVIGMTQQGSGISLRDSEGANRVQLAAGAEQSQIWVEDKVAETRLGTAADGSSTGLTVTKGDTKEIELATDASGGALKTFDVKGVPIAEISAAQDTPLLLYDFDGKPFFSVGLPEGGKRLLTLGGASGARVELGLFTDRAGSFVSVLDKSGLQRAALTADPEEFPISAADEKGKDIFTVGPVDKSGGPVQMTVGDPDAAHVQLGLYAGDSGSFVSALDKSGIQRAALTADSAEPPISVSDAEGTKVFEVGPATETGSDGPLRLTLGKKDAAHIGIGLFTDDAGSYLHLFDKEAKLRSEVTADPTSMPISLFNAQEEPIFTVGDPETPTEPELVLGLRNAAHLQAGVLKGSAGSYLSLYDDGKTERAQITATEKSTQMQLNDANMTVDLGSDLKSDGAGLWLSKDDLDFASIRFSKAKGGSVLVNDPRGSPGVALQAGVGDEGGRVAIAGPGGAKIIGKFWGTADGANLSLYDASGKERVAGRASQKGDLTLFGDGGALGMTSGETAPSLDISDPAGTVLFSAYVTKSGLGAVAVGPGGDGVAGTLTGGKPASALLGKK
jgi:hypothetical protein